MDIIKVIQETATWIEKVNSDYDFNLYRTPELIPNRHYYEIPENEKTGLVSNIVTMRYELLKSADVSLIPVDRLSDYGRIMIFDIDDTFLDGAPEDASELYLDFADAPPCDTWIATGEQLNESGFYTPGNEIKDTVVVAWVPIAQYFYVESAVGVSCLENFWWASNENINIFFEVLKPIFEKPEIFEQAFRAFNLERRAQIHSQLIQYSSQKEGKVKGFFKRLFGK